MNNPAPMGRGPQFALLAAFSAVNLLLLFLAIPEASYLVGGDAALYMGPAKTLVLHGVLSSSLEALDTPLSFAPPLYSLFLSLPVALLPWKPALLAIVLMQLTLLWFTASLTRRLVPQAFAGVRTLAQGLVLLNPNAVITAHLVQSETLFTFFVVIFLVSFLSLLRRPGGWALLVCGASLGLASLTRPVGLFVIPLLPLIFASLLWIQTGRRPALAAMKAPILALAIAATLVAPWYLRNHALFGQFFFTANAGFYLSDQYVEVLQVDRNLSAGAASEQRYRMIAEHLAARGVSSFDQLPTPVRSQITAAIVGPALLELPLSSHLKAFLRALGNLFVSGGASNFSNYLGLEGITPPKFLQAHQGRGLLQLLADFSVQPALAYLGLAAGLLAFALAMRLAGLAGLQALLLNREYVVALLLLGQLAYFTASYLYLGQSRFRVPLEPALMVLAAIGLGRVPGWWSAFRARQSHP